MLRARLEYAGEPARSFTEMDRIADSIRQNNPDLREGLKDELQREFRQLQKRHMPHLSNDEFVDLFERWLLRDLSRLKAERDKALSAIRATIEEAVIRNGEPPPLRCRCGTYIINPFEPRRSANMARICAGIGIVAKLGGHAIKSPVPTPSIIVGLAFTAVRGSVLTTVPVGTGLERDAEALLHFPRVTYSRGRRRFEGK